jgi:hypothetical protein
MIQDVFTVVALAMAAIGLLRLGFLLTLRRPVVARVIGTDLSESERLHDGDMHFVAHFDDLPTTNDVPFRSVTARVEFEAAGRSHRTDVSILTYRGERPDTNLFIWYDPSDPSRATGIGAEWACAMLLPAVCLIANFYW